MLVWNAISSIVLMIFETLSLDSLIARHRRRPSRRATRWRRFTSALGLGHHRAACWLFSALRARHRGHLLHRGRRLLERGGLLRRALRQRLRRPGHLRGCRGDLPGAIGELGHADEAHPSAAGDVPCGASSRPGAPRPARRRPPNRDEDIAPHHVGRRTPSGDPTGIIDFERPAHVVVASSPSSASQDACCGTSRTRRVAMRSAIATPAPMPGRRIDLLGPDEHRTSGSLANAAIASFPNAASFVGLRGRYALHIFISSLRLAAWSTPGSDGGSWTIVAGRESCRHHRA